MQCSDVNPGAVQKGRTAPSSPRRETRELSVIRNAISSREQLRLQTTPKGGVHSNTSQLRWQTVPSLRARDSKRSLAKSSGNTRHIVVTLVCRSEICTTRDFWALAPRQLHGPVYLIIHETDNVLTFTKLLKSHLFDCRSACDC